MLNPDSKRPSFYGLTSKLSKAVYSKEEVWHMCHKYDKKSHYKAGTLPADWIYCVAFENRPKAVKDVLRRFGGYFAKLRTQGHNEYLEKDVSEKITKLFQKNGILKKSQKADVSALENGYFSNVYKLGVNGKNYAVKVFNKIFSAPSTLNDVNGNLFEQNIFLFLKGKLPKRNNNWGTFYFGDFKNGVMVTKFEDGNNAFNGQPFNVEKLGLCLYKNEHFAAKNNIGGKIIDAGCTIVSEPAKNKTISYVYSQTLKDPCAPLKILEETIKWRPSALKSDRFKGVFYSLRFADRGIRNNAIDVLLKHADDEAAGYIAKNVQYCTDEEITKIFMNFLKRENEELKYTVWQKIDELDNLDYEVFNNL